MAKNSLWSAMLWKNDRITNRVFPTRKKARKFTRRARRIGYSSHFWNPLGVRGMGGIFKVK